MIILKRWYYLVVIKSSKKVLIIIPTYNEKENVERIVNAILKIQTNLHILIVDDNSPDKTWQIAQRLSKKNNQVHFIRRDFKEGIGPAYMVGFNYALKNKFDYIFQMDGDFSHDPKMIPLMLAVAQFSDWVIGSRYVKGGNIKGWGARRKIISWLGNFYTKLFLGFQIRDWTSGFSCWNAQVLKKINLTSDENPNGYAFQIAIKYKALLAGFKPSEIPIAFCDRKKGMTKMGGGIVNEAALTVVRLRLMKKELMKTFV
ncbi:MAG: polyprenol monophosphomannose synthase [Patescibacteria group bacterium]